MGIAPTIKYFGRFPTVIVFQGSSSFDGTAQTGTPTIAPGIYTFPLQAGGGLYNFHESPIQVKQIAYSGGGTCLVKKVINGVQTVLIATLTTAAPVDFVDFYLAPAETLVITSSGDTTPVITITAHEASYAADGH